MTVGGELRTLARQVSQLPIEMVRAGAKELRKPLLDSITRDSGGDRQLSGLRNSGRFNVSTSVRGKTTVTGRVYAGPPGMRGPWDWVNSGTRRRRQGRGTHPGTRGKRTWDRVVDNEAHRVMQAMVAEWDKTVGRD